MLEFLHDYLPWIYFRLWMFDYLYIIPEIVTVLSCLISLAYYSIKGDRLKDDDNLRFGEFLSITSFFSTIILFITKYVLVAMTQG